VTPEQITARQLGLIRLDQALAAGLREGQIHHRVRSGRWMAVRPGVYLIVGTPRSWEQAVLAAVLRAGPTAVASHGTAARLYALALADDEAIELTALRPRQVRLDGVVGHRSHHLFDDDRTRCGVIPCTTGRARSSI
jgi:hypothetical protein